MTVQQMAICRAVEVATTDYIQIGYAIGANETINPTQTLYPNVLALIADLGNECSAGLNLILDDEYKVNVVYNRNIGGDIMDAFAGGSTAMLSILGFTGSETAQPFPQGAIYDYIKATYTPRGMWLPSYYTSDNNHFDYEHSQLFSGVVGTDGNLSGIAHVGRQSRECTWPWELSTNAVNGANGATSAQSERAFAVVIEEARAMVLEESGSNNLYCKGVYLIDDINEYTDTLQSVYDTLPAAPANSLPGWWGSGALVGEYGNYLFCSCGDPVINGSPDNTLKSRVDVSLRMTMAVAPSWGWNIR